MAIPIRVVVPNHPDDSDLLELHLFAHKLWTPSDVEIKVVPCADGNYAKACNEGAKGHNGLIVLLNDDTIPGFNWVDDMRANYGAALAETRPGLIGARMDATSGPQALTSGLPFNQLTPHHRVITAAAVVHSEEFWLVGGFDQDFPFWYSDDALCAKLTENGCTNFIGNWYMRHFGFVSTLRRGMDTAKHKAQYQGKFKEKYGGG